MGLSKKEIRRKIRYRIRKKVKGTSERPRLAVFRSNKTIYCQVIDDVNAKTLMAASSSMKGLSVDGNKIEQAKAVGKLIGEKALAANINSLVFDRGGFLYHGRIKALADGIREAGVKI